MSDFNNYTLRFSDNDLEQEYISKSFSRRIVLFRYICIVGLTIHSLFLVKDTFWTPDDTILARAFGVLPMLAIALFLSFKIGEAQYQRFRFLSFATNVVILLGHMLVVAANPTMFTQSSHGIPILIYAVFIFSGLLLRHLLVLVVGGYLIVAGTLIFFTSYSYGEYIDIIILLHIHLCLAYMALYNLEQANRRGIMEKLRAEQSEMLVHEAYVEMYWQKAMYENIVDASVDMIMVTNDKGILEFESKAVAETLGYKSDSMIGKSGFEWVHAEDLDIALKLFQSCLEQGLPTEGEYRQQKSDKTYIWVHAMISPLKDTEGEVSKVMIYSRDVSRKKMEEMNLRISQKELEDLNHQKNRYFSIISHDLRGTVGMVSQMLAFIDQEMDNFSKEELGEMIGNASDSTRKTYNLLNNLLLWAKAQISSADFEKRSIAIAQIVNQSIDDTQALWQNKGITIINKIDKGFVLAEKNMITTAIRNLVSNAIKFSSKDSKILIWSEEYKSDHVIRVQDHGVGMSAEVKANLFDLDEMNSQTGTDGETGTGLGLILVNDLVSQNDGKIEIDSTEGVGTTISVRLPKGEETYMERFS
ncbi:MAG: PAS domain S-box protein [Cyclobacteriaceae bacterium]